jgi:spore germination protein GerM
MRRPHKSALKILIIASVATALGGSLGIFILHSLSNRPRYMGETVPVKVFFGNSKLDPELDCTKVFGVDRAAPKSEEMIKSALQALLDGPAYPESQNGFFTSLNHDIKLNSITFRNNVAYVDFNKELTHNIEGSCRAAGIRSEIVQTLLQFPNIKSVAITVEGHKPPILGE